MEVELFETRVNELRFISANKHKIYYGLVAYHGRNKINTNTYIKTIEKIMNADYKNMNEDELRYTTYINDIYKKRPI